MTERVFPSAPVLRSLALYKGKTAPHPHMKRHAFESRFVADGPKKPKTYSFPSILQGVTCYESMKLMKPAIPAEIRNPKTHLLVVKSEDYRVYGKLAPYTEKSGASFPLNSWMEIVPAINRYLKTCVKGRMIETFYSDDTGQSVSPPSGMHIFGVPCEITEGLIYAALGEVRDLYRNPKYKANHTIHAMKQTPPPACNFLFYPGGGKGPIHIREIFRVLFAEAPALARYVLIYLSVIRDMLRLDDADMDTVAMTINHYDPMGAINPHVDTVFIFNGTLGPIFTVAMGPSEKMLDLLPVLLPDTSRPVRLFSKPNEIMLMDGEARTLWAHAKPWNYPHEQFSVVFKFPEFRTKTHATAFEYEGVPLSIPYHFVSSS